MALVQQAQLRRLIGPDIVGPLTTPASSQLFAERKYPWELSSVETQKYGTLSPQALIGNSLPLQWRQWACVASLNSRIFTRREP